MIIVMDEPVIFHLFRSASMHMYYDDVRMNVKEYCLV